MQKIIVRRFCGVSEIELEIKPLTVLIGPQASGKSLLAKLIFFFQEALSGMVTDASSCTGIPEFKAELSSKFRSYFPPVSWGGKAFEIYYCNGDFSFNMSRTSKSADVKVELSDSIIELFNLFTKEINKIKAKEKMRFIIEDSPEILNHYMSASLRNKTPGFVSGNVLFVPAGRSFFANLDSAVWPILRKQKVIDPFLIGYGVHYQTVKNFYRFTVRESSEKRPVKMAHAEAKLWDIIGGKLSIKKEEEFVENKDGRTIPVANLSSGQQELLPLLLGVFHDFPWMEKPNSYSVFIEEPEAHLFPSAQKDVVEFIATGFNKFNGKGSVFITTHSPYVLATINNLLLASKASNFSDTVKRKVSKIINIDSWLSPNLLSAYAISDGKIQDILDREIDLIDASFIDGVSSEISESFDNIWRAFP